MPRRRDSKGRFVDEGKNSETNEYRRKYYRDNIEHEQKKDREYRLKNREKIRQRRNKYYGRNIPPPKRCTCGCFLDKFGNCNHNRNRKNDLKHIHKRYCNNCGKYYEGWGEKYCSKECNCRVVSPFVKGEKHPFWNNGSSFEPYGLEFNKELKEQINARDNCTCQECGYTQEQLGYKLPTHHIDYNKKNNNPINLISLCRNCHSQTNFNRNDWTKYYNKKVNQVA